MSNQHALDQSPSVVLQDLSPKIVGECLEREWRHEQTGDAVQRTSSGLAPEAFCALLD